MPISKHLTKTELSRMRKTFKPYGAKAELSCGTRIPIGTIHNILKKGSGYECHIDAIRTFWIAKVAAQAAAESAYTSAYRAATSAVTSAAA
jgi:hypothetical protein